MRGDINVRYGVPLELELNRVAVARKMDRADMLRAIAVEAVEAHDSGRLRFQVDDKPRIDSSLSTLAAKLREGVVEMERGQRANLKLEKRLLDALVASETAVQAAEERLVLRVNDINRKSYEPFVARLGEAKTAIAAIGDRLVDSQEASFQIIASHLEDVCKQARAPRSEYNLVLGDDRTLSAKFLACLFAMAAVMGVLAFLWLVTLAQPIGRPVAQRVIANSENFCLLLNDRYGVKDCTVPDEERDLALRVIKAREKGQ